MFWAAVAEQAPKIPKAECARIVREKKWLSRLPPPLVQIPGANGELFFRRHNRKSRRGAARAFNDPPGRAGARAACTRIYYIEGPRRWQLRGFVSEVHPTPPTPPPPLLFGDKPPPHSGAWFILIVTNDYNFGVVGGRVIARQLCETNFRKLWNARARWNWLEQFYFCFCFVCLKNLLLNKPPTEDWDIIILLWAAAATD